MTRMSVLSALAAVAVLGGAVGWVAADRPAQAQFIGAGSGTPVQMGVAAVGTQSHAWAIDPRTSLVIFCTGQAGTKPNCTSAPLPGTANR